MKGVGMAEDIRVGDRVVAPLGVDEVEGVVLRVSSPGVRPMLTVQLDLAELDEPFVTSFPTEVVRLAA
ncbi:hypothetical protein L6E12_13040 [Actinokineospora sp. PR83]|uniref:hypothetical protein n=1 Tax=Actinokineospora sp. PR83 TaxID=2884908 RepID=UPI001F35B5F5|nr:hypothetical protein [Actinokineospora sp. PR83]MCG8916717.1 hypothetical protein [Actinokineospora sp. PR83]